MAVASSDAHRLSREEYERLVSAGFFPPGARIELIEGVLYDMPPQDSPHVTGLHLALAALRTVFPTSYIRIQSPLAVDDSSEPEPDLAVVPGSIRDYQDDHPTTALLVVEIADSSLSHDRQRKIPLYARAGIPEAWILNTRRKELEVYRNPVDGEYRSRTLLRISDSVSPLDRPDIAIPVADLFP
ncbi:MAG TPA: Uma2 family endonuclease [Thermoanaerobaculia bacterium]|nr:Uma2 family endonuclease [Thermoanaerobaculia bacterium]